jgi:hypothetical protein
MATAITKIKKYYEDSKSGDFYTFNDKLKELDAIIAGGAIVSVMTDTRINDMDIYISVANLYEIFLFLKQRGFRENRYLVKTAPRYDNSFFRKNHIHIRVPLVKYDCSIDLICVDVNIDLLKVVSNFDLSFCKVYYEPKERKIKGIGDALKDLSKKEGILGKDYTEKLLTCFNKFTENRIKKYTKKGFKIKYYPVKLKYIELEKCVKNKKMISLEDWYVRMVYSTNVKHQFERVFSNGNYLVKFEYEELKKLPYTHIQEHNLQSIMFSPHTNSLRQQIIINSDIMGIPDSLFVNIIMENMTNIFKSHAVSKNIFSLLVDNGDSSEKLVNMIMGNKDDIINKENYFRFMVLVYPFVENFDLGVYNTYIKNNLNILINIFTKNSQKKDNTELLMAIVSTLNDDLDTVNTDERKLVKDKCLSWVDGEVEIQKQILEESNIVFVPISSDGDVRSDHSICLDKSVILDKISDKDSIFYNCPSEDSMRGINEKEPYLQIWVNRSGTNGIIDLYSALVLLSEMEFQSIFYVLQTDRKLDFTISLGALKNIGVGAYVSANHCQNGSYKNIYTVKICEGDKCVNNKFLNILSRFESETPSDSDDEINSSDIERIEDLIRSEDDNGRMQYMLQIAEEEDRIVAAEEEERMEYMLRAAEEEDRMVRYERLEMEENEVFLDVPTSRPEERTREQQERIIRRRNESRLRTMTPERRQNMIRINERDIFSMIEEAIAEWHVDNETEDIDEDTIIEIEEHVRQQIEEELRTRRIRLDNNVDLLYEDELNQAIFVLEILEQEAGL